MGFLIRCAFWLSLVLLIIPLNTGDNQDADTVNPIEAAFAARGVFQDVTGLCERRPDVCETGRAAFHTIAGRARETMRIASDLIEGDEETDMVAEQKPETAPSDAPVVTTGSVTKGD